MKRLFKAIGKALLYFLVYFGVQMLTSLLFLLIFAFNESFKAMQNGSVDFQALTNDLLNRYTQNANLILLVSGSLTLLLLYLVFVIRKKQPLHEIELSPVRASTALSALGLGVALHFFVVSIISWLYEIQVVPQSLLDSYSQSSAILEGGGPIVQIVNIALLTPIVEEVVFRGLIYTRLKRGMPFAVALLIESACFGLLHGQLLWAAYGFLLGVVLTLCFERAHSLAAPICIHFAFNASNLLSQFLGDASAWLVVLLSVLFTGIFLWIFLHSTRIPQPARSIQNEAK